MHELYSVVAVALYLCCYFIGHEVADGLAFFNGIPDVGSGYFQQGRFQYFYAGAFIGGGYLMARAFVNIDGVVRQNMLVVFPAGKVFKAITAHDYRELVLRVFFAEVGKGIRRIGRAGQAKLNVCNLQVIGIFDGELYKVQAVKFIQ